MPLVSSNIELSFFTLVLFIILRGIIWKLSIENVDTKSVN